jgi:hypothetical protein
MNRGTKAIDMIGRKYNLLTVLEYVNGDTSKNRSCVCRCDCGNTKITLARTLRRGQILSCGCLKNNCEHVAVTKIYNVWSRMKQRCLNTKAHAFEFYGGRGITVCEEWKNNFKSFHEWAIATGYKENQGLSIDRINNNKGYSPNNCRWATNKMQSNNTRRTRKMTINGITKNTTEWMTLAANNKLKGYSKPLKQSNEAFIQFMQTKIEQGEITL